VLEETQETAEIIQRVAALDVGKAELTCCVRVPSPGHRGKRAQEVRTYQTIDSLAAGHDRPAGRVGRGPGW
jgi:transposase